MKKIFTILALMMISTGIYAQSWRNLVGKHLYLTKYGAYSNNREVNVSYPSGKNANEYILLIDGNLIWGNSLNGNKSYKYTINNNILNISNSKEKGWIKILRQNQLEVVTVDGNNTYRYFSFDPPGYRSSNTQNNSGNSSKSNSFSNQSGKSNTKSNATPTATVVIDKISPMWVLKCLYVNYHYSVLNANGHTIRPYLYIERPEGTYYKTKDGFFVYAKGNASTISKSSQDFTKCSLSIDYKNHGLISGTQVYYAKVWIKDETLDKWIGHSASMKYTIDNSNNLNSSSVSSNSNFQKKTTVVSTKPSCSFERIWVDHNVTENGQKGMRIHAKFKILNASGKQCRMNAYFWNKESKVIDKNKNYYASDGQVAAWTDFKPWSDNQTFNDLKIFLPYDELHLSAGKYELNFTLGAWIGNSFIKRSDKTYFSFSQPGQNQNNNRTNNSPSLPQLPQNSQHPAQWVLCSSCNGSKICQTCNGSGYTKWVFSQQYGDKACSICNGGIKGAVRGQCLSCRGLGYQILCDGQRMLYDSYLKYIKNNYVSQRDCAVCNGTGNCPSCGGKGMTYNQFNGSWSACITCVNANGRCKWCYGSGKTNLLK